MTRALPGWRHAVPPPDALAWARNNRLNPTVTRGDFDADRRADWAALVNAPDGSAKVAVCFSSKGRRLPPRLMLIDEPYCRDVLYLARAGSVHHNYETYVEERITRDGISVSCLEKAGARTSTNEDVGGSSSIRIDARHRTPQIAVISSIGAA